MNLKRYLPALALCFAGYGSAHAAGFALIENSASGMGNAFSGAAAVADDASTVWFNPAGMSRLEGRQAVLAGHLILPGAAFEDRGSSVSAALGGTPLSGSDDKTRTPAAVPNTYLVGELDNGVRLGLGINAPFGLTTEYNDDWIGRYHAVKSDMKTVNFNPSIAFQASERLSLGLGANIQYVEVELTSAVDFGSLCYSLMPASSCGAAGLAPQQNDGFARVAGSNWALGWNAGLLFDLNDQTRLGVAYRSAVTQKVGGKAEFSVPGEAAFITASGAFTDSAVQARVTLPDSLSLSLAHQPGDGLTLLFDATLTRWSRFEELRIEYDNPAQPDSVTTENWQDSWRFSAGANIALDEDLTLRLGAALDQTPIPDAEHRTPRMPGNDRWWLSAGLGYQYSPDLRLDLGYSHLFVEEADIDNTLETSVPTLQHTLEGRYTSSVNIISAQASLSF